MYGTGRAWSLPGSRRRNHGKDTVGCSCMRPVAIECYLGIRHTTTTAMLHSPHKPTMRTACGSSDPTGNDFGEVVGLLVIC